VPTSAQRLTADDVLDVVAGAIALVLEVDRADVRPDTAFSSLEADSLALVEIAEIVEVELGPRSRTRFRIADADLEALRTVGDAVDYVLGRA